MPRQDPLLELQKQINELKKDIAKLKSRQRNIDTLALRDGVTAPVAVPGQAIQYVDIADGDLKVIYGNGHIEVIAPDS